jgi:hypothetical protein
MGIEIPTFESEGELKEYARKMLIKTYINQLAIVEHKQTDYMQGRGRYPQNEITGLKTLLSCMGALSDNKDSVLDDDEVKNKPEKQKGISDEIALQIKQKILGINKDD